MDRAAPAPVPAPEPSAAAPTAAPRRVLIVCAGNLCRSPMAHALVRHHAARRGAAGRIVVDSAGTHPFHPGGPAHPDTLAVLAHHGIDAAGLTCRGVVAEDFEQFERIVAVDRPVLRRLAAWPQRRARLELLLHYGASGLEDVPDPYLDGRFAELFALLDEACAGLVDALLEPAPEPPATPSS
ncbi:MAG: low molecular weight phosphotyrosine protein phosphatase [Planctomycetes bacterium]|nr:low molecular weight phosphotyrosine protein phosphatase [Planctomycetota bacterium]